MKRRIILLCILVSTFFIVACIAQQSRPGVYLKASPTQKEVVDAAAFAIKSQGESMHDAKGGQPTKLELVKILGA
ncbi:MAG: hypothetical protein PHO83_17695, partial [Geobacteraceae bacterium]|nr:hypothetical protein [Geobacteraceae bacterium]